ncbi:MAG: SRPBCC family protein [Myxococcota bacterium]
MSAFFSLLLPMVQAAPPDQGVSWETLLSSPVHIECATVDGTPWCRSTGVIGAPLGDVSHAIGDMRHNADKFENVLKIDIIDPDTVRVVLDYPQPLSDRDYVARYTRLTDGEATVYRWEPVPGAAPAEAGVVRLPNFAGEWRFEPVDASSTRVRYTWHAEINGSFPAFAYETAWKRAGQEALKDLAKTQGASLNAP